MDDKITTTKELRKAIRKATSIYVAIMMGNASYEVKITKSEATALAREIDFSWKNSLIDLDVTGYGFMTYNGVLHLGGL